MGAVVQVNNCAICCYGNGYGYQNVVTFSTATNDFIGRTGVTVTFASDQIAIVNITVVNDDTLENTEQFTAVLTIPGSMLVIGAATVTITDDDSKPYFHPYCQCNSEINATNRRVLCMCPLTTAQ